MSGTHDDDHHDDVNRWEDEGGPPPGMPVPRAIPAASRAGGARSGLASLAELFWFWFLAIDVVVVDFFLTPFVLSVSKYSSVHWLVIGFLIFSLSYKILVLSALWRWTKSGEGALRRTIQAVVILRALAIFVVVVVKSYDAYQCDQAGAKSVLSCTFSQVRFEIFK